VMWQAYSGPALESQIILHRRKISTESEWEWGSPTAFLGNDDYYRPSITGFARNQSEDLKAVWYRSTDMLWKADFDGASWSDFYAWDNGYDPTLSMNVNWQDASSLMVFRKYADVPYLLHSHTGLGELSKEKSLQFTHHRRGVLSLGKAAISFELGEFEVNGRPVKLFHYPDTLIVGHNGRWEEMFRSEPFRVNTQSSLRYFRGFEVLNRDSLQNTLPPGARIIFRLEVVDAQTGQVLTAPDLLIVTRNIPANIRQFKNLVLPSVGNKTVFLRVGLTLPPALDIKQTMVEAYYEPSDNGYYKSVAENLQHLEQKPKIFKLYQNYPNPFNPSTTISFNLPDESRVMLEIYDITGRKIRVLAEGRYPAGSHRVVWDGRDSNGQAVASGVYAYRLRVFAPMGKAGKHVTTRKLLLMK